MTAPVEVDLVPNEKVENVLGDSIASAREFLQHATHGMPLGKDDKDWLTTLCTLLKVAQKDDGRKKTNIVLAKDCLKSFDCKAKGELETLHVLMGAMVSDNSSVHAPHASNQRDGTTQQLSDKQCDSFAASPQPFNTSKPDVVTQLLPSENRSSCSAIEASAASTQRDGTIQKLTGKHCSSRFAATVACIKT